MKNETKTKFNIIGYYEDYFVDNKFIGTKRCDEQPDRTKGFFGQKYFFATDDIILEKGKKIKRGTKYKTYYNQLSGKFIGTQQEKLQAIQQSTAWKNTIKTKQQ
jgi:hypothetical protein